MKKAGNSILKCELDISTNTNIFEKKPTKGGTPAKDRIANEIIFVKMWVEPKLENEKRVLTFVPITCSTVVKRRNEVKL